IGRTGGERARASPGVLQPNFLSFVVIEGRCLPFFAELFAANQASPRNFVNFCNASTLMLESAVETTPWRAAGRNLDEISVFGSRCLRRYLGSFLDARNPD